MNLHKIALAVFLGAASMAASAADNSTSQSPDASGSFSLANSTKGARIPMLSDRRTQDRRALSRHNHGESRGERGRRDSSQVAPH